MIAGLLSYVLWRIAGRSNVMATLIFSLVVLFVAVKDYFPSPSDSAVKRRVAAIEKLLLEQQTQALDAPKATQRVQDQFAPLLAAVNDAAPTARP